MKFQRYLIAALLVLGSSAAMAATTDTITLSGEVASTVSIACTDTAGALTLDFDGGSGVQIVKVSDCAASTNDDAGLTVTFTPAIAGFVKAGTSDVFAFAVESVADEAIAPVEGAFPVDAAVDTFATAASGAGDSDVYIKFTQNAAHDPGTYTASIGVVVADNT